MSRIPQHFIDDLLNRLDIVEVVDSRVKLRKTGKNYSACCPFHKEKTPSFTVSPEKQFYYCFGCGASGTALGFVMEYEHLGFVEAVESLAASAGLSVPREEHSAAPQKTHQNPGAGENLLRAATGGAPPAPRSHPLSEKSRPYGHYRAGLRLGLCASRLGQPAD
jgi:DNA primase